MYEFHGWFVLAETAEAVAATGSVGALIENLRGRLALFSWYYASADLQQLNGQYVLNVTGFLNRPWQEARDLEMLLGWFAEQLPGSYGLLYELSDYMPVPPGPRAFGVRVLAGGRVVERLDPFLSPTQPTIEDLPSDGPWVD